jgi:hypothetical protein
MEAALILTRISPGFGEGRSSPETLGFSRPPGAVNLAKRIYAVIAICWEGS